MKMLLLNVGKISVSIEVLVSPTQGLLLGFQVDRIGV